MSNDKTQRDNNAPLLKQSSVDFYAEQSLNLFNLFQKGQISMNEFKTKMYEVEIQSTKMHKEEIIISHINGQAEYDQLAYRDIVKHVAEQYYNATFGAKQ